MAGVKYKFGLPVSFVFLLIQMFRPGPVFAQWPPFAFHLDASYAEGKITYKFRFYKRVDEVMSDVAFKFPLPQGTRFLEAGAPPTTSVNFDGAEITFFTSVLHRSLSNAYFVVEVIDPTKTQFTTQASIAWKGAQPGDYLTKEATIDITRTPLTWHRPYSRLQLEAGATVVDNVITYTIYPMNIGGRRMWDLTITAPLPEGTTFLAAEAPPPFVTNFDGRQVIFSILELEQNVEIAPLRVRVSTTGVTTPFVTARARATWKNVGPNVPAQEQTQTGDIIVRPHATQQVVSDPIGDTPFSNYDLTGLSFQEEEAALKITFYAAGNLGPIGQPLEYNLYIDSDCNAETGTPKGGYGAEYWLRYSHEYDGAYFYVWKAEENKWNKHQAMGAYTVEGKLVTVSVPHNLLDSSQQFCWLAVTWNGTRAYYPAPPIELMGKETRLARYEAVTVAPE